MFCLRNCDFFLSTSQPSASSIVVCFAVTLPIRNSRWMMRSTQISTVVAIFFVGMSACGVFALNCGVSLMVGVRDAVSEVVP